MSAGPDKTRRRNTASVRRASFEWVMTQAQWEIFDAFFLTTLAGGALSFTLPRPSTGNDADWRIVGLPEYTPLTPRRAADLGAPLGRWLVSFEAELLPQSEISVDPPPPPPPDDGAQVFEFELFPSPAEIQPEPVVEALSALMPDLTIFGAAPPAQEDYIMLLVMLDATAPISPEPESMELASPRFPGDSDGGTDYGGGEVIGGAPPVGVPAGGVGIGIS